MRSPKTLNNTEYALSDGPALSGFIPEKWHEPVGAQAKTSGARCEVRSDVDGTIQEWNAGAALMFGYSRDQMVGQSLRRLWSPRQSDISTGAEWLRQKVNDPFETVALRRDGTQVKVNVHIKPATDEHGQIAGYITDYATITERESSLGASRTSGFASVDSKPKVLLATAAAAGTIAAARLLHRFGFDVGVVSHEPLSSAAWSRSTTRSYTAPPERESEKFLARLLEIGAKNPGQILLPTSDQTSWLYTVHSAELSKYFRLYQPAVSTMHRILDKYALGQAAARAGVPVLPSWEPSSIDEVEALSSQLPYPVLIKPRSHIDRLRNDKGVVIRNREDLVEQYRKYVVREGGSGADELDAKAATFPLLQQFVDVTADGVHSISGFVDHSGELFVARQAVKVFQRSYPVGVGICFEALPTMPALAEHVRRLCRELNYFGMFEVEFLRFGTSWAIIDFNPRLFNQIGLDIRRGMPLPLLSCLDLLGRTDELAEAVERACAREGSDNDAVFCDRFTFHSILFAKRLTGRISPEDLVYWQNWWKRNSPKAVDFAYDPEDKWPGWIHQLSEIRLGLQAFPKFLRLTPRAS